LNFNNVKRQSKAAVLAEADAVELRKRDEEGEEEEALPVLMASSRSSKLNKEIKRNTLTHGYTLRP
jgi:hypothetical protein